MNVDKAFEEITRMAFKNQKEDDMYDFIIILVIFLILLLLTPRKDKLSRPKEDAALDKFNQICV